MVRVTLAAFAATAVAAIAAVTLPVGAGAHQSGCHSAHSCPSDHHTYLWYDASGQAWDCASPTASERDPSRDTTPISYGGMTWYCRPAGSAPQPTPSPDPAQSTAPPASQPAEQTSTAPSARCRVRGALPDRACTPGAHTSATKRQVCTRGYARRVRHVTSATKDRVYAEYGVTSHPTGSYEVDHLVPLELGGSNALRNLWPEAAKPTPGYHQKDRLENALHARVCGGKMSLAAAQKAFTRDWLKSYRRYVR